MFPRRLAGLEVEVVDVVILCAAGFPWLGQWRLETLLGDVKQVLVDLRVHAKVSRVFDNLFVRRLIVFVAFFDYDTSSS